MANVRSSLFFRTKLFGIDQILTGKVVPFTDNAQAALDTQQKLDEIKEEQFKRNLGIKAQEIAQAKVYAALTDPKAYLTARSQNFQAMIETLKSAYDDVLAHNFSAGMSQLQAEQLALSAIAPLKANLQASFAAQWPADAEAFDRSIRKQRAESL